MAASLAPRLEAMAQAGRAQVESLEEALEERELAVARLGRELEALWDTQVAGTAEVAQRELSRTEVERRVALVGEQRACWSTLQEVSVASGRPPWPRAVINIYVWDIFHETPIL